MPDFRGITEDKDAMLALLMAVTDAEDGPAAMAKLEGKGGRIYTAAQVKEIIKRLSESGLIVETWSDRIRATDGVPHGKFWITENAQWLIENGWPTKWDTRYMTGNQGSICG